MSEMYKRNVKISFHRGVFGSQCWYFYSLVRNWVLVGQVDEELDELISRIKLEEGNTEFWKRRFLGEGLNGDDEKIEEIEDTEVSDVLIDETEVVEDVAKEDADDDEADEEEEEVEQTDSQIEAGDRVKEKAVGSAKPLQMIGVQLLKDSDQTTAVSKKSRRRSSRISVEV